MAIIPALGFVSLIAGGRRFKSGFGPFFLLELMRLQSLLLVPICPLIDCRKVGITAAKIRCKRKMIV